MERLNSPVFICGVMVCFFLVIALGSIALIFQPVTHHERVQDISGQYQEVYAAPSAITYEGMALRAEAWKEYPKYNIGLGVITGLAFTGSIFMTRLMFLLKNKEDDAL